MSRMQASIVVPLAAPATSLLTKLLRPASMQDVPLDWASLNKLSVTQVSIEVTCHKYDPIVSLGLHVTLVRSGANVG